MVYVKIKNLALLFSLVVAALSFSNCSDDKTTDDPSIDPTAPTVAIDNDELEAALKDKGLKFNSKGELVLDSATLQLEELDLSNAGLTSVSGLKNLAGLKSVDLSDNDFGEYVECSELPEGLESLTFNDNNNTKELNDLEKLTSLKSVVVEDCDMLERIEMPSSLYGESNYAYTSINNNVLRISDCAALKAISMPATGNSFGLIELEDLPNVTYLDLSRLSIVHTLILSDLNKSIGIRMPSALSGYADGWGSVSTDGLMVFAVDSEVSKIASVASFLSTFESNILDASDYYLD